MILKKSLILQRMLIAALILRGGCLYADETATEKTIKELYASSQAALRAAQTKEDLARVLGTFAPEWVGNMPAGETLTFADLIKESEAGLAIPPEKRPLPKMSFVYVRETGWNVLVVYWNYRQIGKRIVGSLYRDTWARATPGWQRIRQEKFFPDRTLSEDGKPAIIPIE